MESHPADRTDPQSAPPAPDNSTATDASDNGAEPAGGGACSFLIGAGGAWRMTVPDREHRCAAFSPATSLAPGKQSRLCLTAAHTGCATYLASTSARQKRVGAALAGSPAERAGRWGIARTTPVVREIGGLRATLGALVADRRTWPAIPAALLATLAVALGLSGTWGEAPVTAVASPTAMPVATPSPTASPTSAPSEPVTTPVPSLVPPSAAASPRPSVAYTTYTVQSGDTLYDIARQFGTTVKAIQALNNLSGTTLHAGQVLKIPTS